MIRKTIYGTIKTDKGEYLVIELYTDTVVNSTVAFWPKKGWYKA